VPPPRRLADARSPPTNSPDEARHRSTMRAKPERLNRVGGTLAAIKGLEFLAPNLLVG
jgi:hypothetical protein